MQSKNMAEGTKHALRVVFLLLFCCFTVQSTTLAADMYVLSADVSTDDAVEAVGGISASGYAVYDSMTGRFIAGSNGDVVMKMASTTKIMTALVALENYSLEDSVTFSREMTAIGSSMYLQYGEAVTVRDLLYGLMMMSGNDAARALASLADGGEQGFVRLMNEKAKSLGLKNTSFKNPNGLDADGHHTTANELALLTAYAMKNPVFREIVSTKNGVFAGRSMTNHNKLLSRIDGCVGVKTGYTTGAGRCLVSAVEHDGRDIIVVTLRASDDWRDHQSLHAWAAEKYPVTEVITEGQMIANLSVAGGESGSVELKTSSALSLGLSSDEAERVKIEVFADKFIYAPIIGGGEAGYAVVSIGGVELARIPLVYSETVAAVNPSELTLSDRVTDFLETLAWSVGICYNAR